MVMVSNFDVRVGKFLLACTADFRRIVALLLFIRQLCHWLLQRQNRIDESVLLRDMIIKMMHDIIPAVHVRFLVVQEIERRNAKTAESRRFVEVFVLNAFLYSFPYESFKVDV